MSATKVQCLCGFVKIELHGEPALQFYCHCNDCQAVHGAAYVAVATYPAQNVRVTHGTTTAWTYKSMARHRCPTCGTRLFAEPTPDLRGVVASLLPEGMFKPAFHIQCRHAVLPVKDKLPHYKEFPAIFGGSDEIVGW